METRVRFSGTLPRFTDQRPRSVNYARSSRGRRRFQRRSQHLGAPPVAQLASCGFESRLAWVKTPVGTLPPASGRCAGARGSNLMIVSFKENHSPKTPVCCCHSDTEMLSTSNLRHQLGLFDQMLLKFINNWRKAADAVYLLHPSDGSLLIWCVVLSF